MKLVVPIIPMETISQKEQYLQITKNILRKCSLDDSDIQLTLSNYRNTPRNNVLGSPDQRLFSRITRSILPVSHEKLKPKTVTNVNELRELKKTYADTHTKCQSSR